MDIDIMTLFATVAGFAAGAVAVTQALKAWLQELIGKELKSWLKWLLSFVAAIALSMVGWGFHIGCFAGMEWYIVLCTGVLTALASEGLYDSILVQWIIDLFTSNSRKTSKASLEGSPVELVNTAIAEIEEEQEMNSSKQKPTFEETFRKMLYSGNINPDTLKTLMAKYKVEPCLKPKYAAISGEYTDLTSEIGYWIIRMRCLGNVANIEEFNSNADGTKDVERYISVRINNFEDWINLETCIEKIAWNYISPTTKDAAVSENHK